MGTPFLFMPRPPSSSRGVTQKLSVVRLDTYKAGAYLVWQLKHAGAIIHEDGGDIIHVRVPTGEEVSIHLIESSIEPYEIRNIVAYNHAAGVHTLFLVWCDMFLPAEGHVVEVQDWEWPMLALYGDRIWAYDVFGGEVFIFPVIYNPNGAYRHITYGKTVTMRQLMGATVEIKAPYIKGAWRVAGFHDKSQPHRPHYHYTSDHAAAHSIPETLVACYTILGLDADDVNRSPDATARMQALNEAYRLIMREFDDE
jgi:hypothetical protein